MTILNLNVASYKPVTGAGGNVVNRSGVMLGYVCTSSTSGTLSLYDDAATGTSTPIIVGLPLVAGQWYPLPFCFSNGINAVVGGTATGTLSLTVSIG